MKWLLLTILGLSFISAGAQSVRLPSGDSITYDFSGATRKGSPGLYKYFTTNIADDGRITRNVADFNRDSLGGKGWRGMINFQSEYVLDSIKFYDRSGSVDTFWIYTLDKNHPPGWDTIISPEDHTPDYLVTTCGSCAGLPVTTKINALANDTVQFVFVVMRKTNLFSGLWPNVSSVSFYGRSTGRADTVYNLAPWAMNNFSPRTIGEIVMHYNLPNQQDTTWADTALVDYGYQRTFDQMFFDDEAVPFGSNRISMGGYGYTANKYNEAMARRGHYQWAAVFSNNAYYNFQLDSAGQSVSKGWSVNTIYDSPQLPKSYSRKGYYMHALALIGGNCAGCTPVRTYNGDSIPAKGFLKYMGTSNEPTLFAFARAWKNAIEVAAEAIGVYDSVKLGDPDMPVIVAGYEAYNYDDAKATIMAMKLYSKSRTIKLDGIDFHAIHSLKTDSFDVIPTTDQQIFNHGVNPGYWADWRKNMNYINGVRREAGNALLSVFLTEDTEQKGVYARKPLNSGETFTISQLGTPRITLQTGPTLDAYFSHGVTATQIEFIATASDLDQHYWYQIVDDKLYTDSVDGGDGTYDAIDANNGKFDRPLDFTDRPQSWAADYFTASRKRRLADYYCIDTLSMIQGGLHVFKYRHISNPDSLMFEYANLDSAGTATYEITGLNASSGITVTPSGTSRTAGESSASIIGGAITVTADPLPRALIVYSPASTNAIYYFQINKRVTLFEP